MACCARQGAPLQRTVRPVPSHRHTDGRTTRDERAERANHSAQCAWSLVGARTEGRTPMSRASYAGGCAVLGVLAIALAGCAATVQPDGLQTHETPPIASCPDTRPGQLPDVSGSALVPDTPTLAFACRYAGLNDPHPNALV